METHNVLFLDSGLTLGGTYFERVEIGDLESRGGEKDYAMPTAASFTPVILKALTGRWMPLSSSVPTGSA